MAAVEPIADCFVAWHDLNRRESWVPQNSNQPLAVLLEQALGTVDVRPYDECIIVALLEDLFHAERRPCRVLAALVDGNLDSGEKILNMLPGTAWIQQVQQMRAVGGREFHPREENRGVVPTSDRFLKVVYSLGGVVVGDRDRFNADIV